MTAFIPPGCVSCDDVLNEIYATKFSNTKRVPCGHWRLPFHRGINLSASESQVQLYLKTLHILQSQLYLGERIACYASGNGLVNLDVGIFALDGATESLANGEIHPRGWSPTAGNISLFIRAENPQISDGVTQAAARNSAPLPKMQQLAYDAYWDIYPEGHRATADKWPLVARRISLQAERKISEDTIRRALGEKK